MASTSRIPELSATIAANTAVLDDYLKTYNAPQPSFDVNGHASLIYPPDIDAAKEAIEEATQELNELVQSPRALLMGSANIFAARAFIFKFDIGELVQADGSISYEDLATSTGVNQGALEALLRLAIAHRIFAEPIAGRVAHSAASNFLREPSIATAGKAFADDYFPTSATIARALFEHPQANEPTQAAAAVLNCAGGKKSLYEILADHPQRAKVIRDTISLWKQLPGFSWNHLVIGFDWVVSPSAACAWMLEVDTEEQRSQSGPNSAICGGSYKIWPPALPATHQCRTKLISTSWSMISSSLSPRLLKAPQSSS